MDEARQVTVAMADKAFVPPPRRVDDILTILDQEGSFDPEVKADIASRADVTPPATEEAAELARFYFERGLRARDLSRYAQWLEDHRKAMDCEQRARRAGERGLGDRGYSKLLTELAAVEIAYGNLKKAIALHQESLRVNDKNIKSMKWLASLYLKGGDFEAGERAAAACIRTCDRLLHSPKAPPGMKEHARSTKALMQAELLETRGDFERAEPVRRAFLEWLNEKTRAENRPSYIAHRGQLAMNLGRQGRLLEAELEIRETVKEAVEYFGRTSGDTALAMGHFGVILMMQGRFDDAEKVLKGCLRMLEASGFSGESLYVGQARRRLGALLVARGDFAEAMAHYDAIREAMHENTYLIHSLLEQNPDYMLALVKTGRPREAMDLISVRLRIHRESLGENHRRTAEMLGLRAMAHALTGKKREAIEDFRATLPLLLSNRSMADDQGRGRRLKRITEVYLDLLGDMIETGEDRAIGIDAPAEIFKRVGALTGRMVQGALGASGARAAATDPELADLVRREQDAAKQMETLKETLLNVLAMPPDQQDPEALADLKRAIDSLARARETLLSDIQKRFPRYADFVMPEPLDLEEAQGLLKEGESLLVIYPMSKRTFVWAIPWRGSVAFVPSPLNKEAIDRAVKVLRAALDPPWGVGTLGSIPDLDLNIAYGLYQALLEPVKTGWEGSKDLLVVAHGALGFLPLSILPTEAAELGAETEPIFSSYRSVPWLARSHAVSMLPSVTSLQILRGLPPGKPGRRALTAFGDPVFDPAQTSHTEEKQGPSRSEAMRGASIARRGLTQTVSEEPPARSAGIEGLSPLPDTADEVRGIARALEADPGQDLFLGRAASEDRLKSMDLSDVRILVFATHGLLPGELDGLTQPALALSSPKATGGKEDGLLTLGEILKMRLNADWVVLSACNTGAGDGAGAEAVSGLGRAFFYAGTRAMLVSHWPVESTSAKTLTTELFRRQAIDPRLTRSEALKETMLALIDHGGYRDEGGQLIFSYAHPIFWAAFTVIGDGG